ncbi:hypothetical protein AAFP35_21185 [Gordonia sp. CPCC 206044]|uniref:hypothetical protein n=1 Tax=Gordonia sp. CPCC 206044 TaxID=3140793 RepID=UPI003AF3D57C
MNLQAPPLTDIALAEAEADAADAEAAAARAHADAARARANLERLRRDSTTPDATGSVETDSESTPVEELAPVEKDPPNDTGEEQDSAVRVDDAETDGSVESNDAKSSTAPQASRTTDSANRTGRIRRMTAAVRRSVRIARPGKRGLLVAVMSLVAIAALAATGYIGWNHRQAGAESARAEAFSAAADRGVTTITSLDYRNAKRDVQRVLDQSTGAFYNDFKGRADDFASVIEQSKVTTKGKVTASAVESVVDDQAVVLVSASSDVTNAAGAQQEPRTWRLRVTVTDADGTMKISKVDFVP